MFTSRCRGLVYAKSLFSWPPLSCPVGNPTRPSDCSLRDAVSWSYPVGIFYAKLWKTSNPTSSIPVCQFCLGQTRLSDTDNGNGNDGELECKPRPNDDNVPNARHNKPRTLLPGKRLAFLLHEQTQRTGAVDDNTQGKQCDTQDLQDTSPSEAETRNSESAHNYLAARTKLSRMRHLSPAKRLSGALPADFWSTQNTHTKEIVHAVEQSANDISGTLKHTYSENHEAQSHCGYNDKDLSTHLDMDELGSVDFQKLPAQCGEYIIVELPCKNSQYGKAILRMVPEHGTIHLNIKGKEKEIEICGTKLPSSVTLDGDEVVRIRRPTLEDYCLRNKKCSYTCHPQVQNKILFHIGVRQGDKVLEAGCGSGLTSLHLSKTVGEEGRITSADTLARHVKIAKANFETWCCSFNKSHNVPWPNNVRFEHTPVEDVVTTTLFDKVYLDLPNVVGQIAKVDSLLRTGGCVALFSPSISKIISALEAIKDHDIPWLLEGVYEENHTTWKTTIQDESHYLSTRTQDPFCTAFVGVFRKITGKSAIDEQDTDGRSNVIVANSLVCLSLDNRPKKGHWSGVVCTLTPGGTTHNHWGRIEHDEFIGKPFGHTFTMSNNARVYAYHPSLVDVLQKWDGPRKTNYTAKQLDELCTMVDVNSGERVLEISDGPGPLTALLSQLVGPSGHIDVLSRSGPKEFSSLMKLLTEHGIIYTNFCHHQTSEDEFCLMRSIPPKLYNAVSISTPNGHLYLDGICGRLQPDALVGLLCKSAFGVNSTLNMIASQRLPLRLVDIVETSHRPWLVQEADVHHPDSLTFPAYICRPKQGIKPAVSAFIIRLQFETT